MEEGGGGRGGDGTNGIEFIIQFNTTRAFVQTDRIIINFQNSLRHFLFLSFCKREEERERKNRKNRDIQKERNRNKKQR